MFFSSFGFFSLRAFLHTFVDHDKSMSLRGLSASSLLSLSYLTHKHAFLIKKVVTVFTVTTIFHFEFCFLPFSRPRRTGILFPGVEKESKTRLCLFHLSFIEVHKTAFKDNCLFFFCKTLDIKCNIFN